MLIGVLDTGCDADHIQLRQKRIDFRYVPHHSESDNLREVRGFDVDGHGTHVCGIIAGRHIGVAPGADLMVVSVIESERSKRVCPVFTEVWTGYFLKLAVKKILINQLL